MTQRYSPTLSSDQINHSTASDDVAGDPPKTLEQMNVGIDERLLGQQFDESELVIGLVGAVGTNLKDIGQILSDRLKTFKYVVEIISVSKNVISSVASLPSQHLSEYDRISQLMDTGDNARKDSNDNSILSLGVAAKIAAGREGNPQEGTRHHSKRAYIVDSLKHPDEVARLREIYPEGFFLIGVHADPKRRLQFLIEDRRIGEADANRLMKRDEDEKLPHGQRTSDTFHLSDFFVRFENNDNKRTKSVWRILDLIFGTPHATPTFDEYAMFMAFSASLRSADLARQVGAVIAKDNQIISTGANDCPKFGGGLHWPEYSDKEGTICDVENGRDYMRGKDANTIERIKMVDEIMAKLGGLVSDTETFRELLEESRIKDITEYGRVVHAEMEALLSCARTHASTHHGTLYCTTFPCHNCAKHIIAAGITRVVFVEPYPKSKALELHDDAMTLGFPEENENGKQRVCFEPFVGVGPRRFFDLFSMRLGSGYPLRRKDNDGKKVFWKQEGSKMRMQMLPCSYLELEFVAASKFNDFRKRRELSHGG